MGFLLTGVLGAIVLGAGGVAVSGYSRRCGFPATIAAICAVMVVVPFTRSLFDGCFAMYDAIEAVTAGGAAVRQNI